MDVQFKGAALPIENGAAEALAKLRKLRVLRGKPSTLSAHRQKTLAKVAGLRPSGHISIAESRLVGKGAT